MIQKRRFSFCWHDQILDLIPAIGSIGLQVVVIECIAANFSLGLPHERP